MTDIFFSYSREDKDRVAFIAAALEAEGYDLWWDTDIAPGETYRGVTQARLRAAKCVIVVWSEISVHSRWVIGEAEEGLTRDILLPIMIDDVVREVPIDFRSIQAANLTRWKGDRSDHEWKKVLASVKRFVEQPARTPQTYRKPKRASSGGGRAMTALAVFMSIILAGVGFLNWSATRSDFNDEPAPNVKETMITLDDGTQLKFVVIHERKTMYVPVRAVAVYVYPSLQADSFGAFQFGEKVQVLGRINQGLDGQSWYQVSGPGGRVGYVLVTTLSDEAPSAAEEPEPSEPVFTVTAASGSRYTTGEANVRAGPGVEYEIVARLGAGEEVTLTGKVDGENWYRIKIADGVEAYISGNLLGNSPPSTGPIVGERFRDCAGCPEMVAVPAGSFRMGDLNGGGGADEKPVHTVKIAKPFAVGVFEVTFAEWDACVAASGCSGYRPADNGWGRGRRPVINVSWVDAQNYVAWLSRKTGKNYRLLSEAKWEYVARAGSATKYHFGNAESSLCRYANGADLSTDFDSRNKACSDGYGKQTAPAGTFQPNAFGLYDMHGNVWEWVSDCWNESYNDAPSNGRVWEEGDCTLRVLRGGSWDFDPRGLRSAIRHAATSSTNRYKHDGFRLSRTLD